MRYDYAFALGSFVVTAASVLLHPLMAVPAALAALNLIHQRHVANNAGEPFARRVSEVVRDELKRFDVMVGNTIVDVDQRLTRMNKAVEDVKEAQIRIGGAFRGRQL